MRGHDRPQATMLTLVNPEQRVPANHPIRLIKPLAEVALKELSPLFEQMYSKVGWPSIRPERLLKASLLMALYTVRSERMFCEQLDYNLLFRWFLDLHWDEPGFDHSSFSRNRARLLEHDVAGEFFRPVVAEARELKLTSDEHFTVDGTLIEAWASLKSFRPKGEQPSDRTPPDDQGNPSVDFHGIPPLFSIRPSSPIKTTPRHRPKVMVKLRLCIKLSCIFYFRIVAVLSCPGLMRFNEAAPIGM